MVTIQDSDIDMGRAGDVTFGIPGEMPRVDGRPVISFSAAARQAYGAVADSEGIAYWSLTEAQVAELLERAPERRLASEIGPAL